MAETMAGLFRPKDLVSVPNMAFGFLGVLAAAHGRTGLFLACMATCLASDHLDGWVARRWSVPTEFGKRLDMADLVSFALAPAVFAYERWGGGWGGWLLMAALALMVTAAWLRLARHQTLPDAPHFVGLPVFVHPVLIPALAWVGAQAAVVVAYCVVTSALMVASFRLPRSLPWMGPHAG